MSITDIHGQSLHVTVVECTKLKDREWIKRQEPYVCLDYGTTKFRTRICTDGHKNPVFQEQFKIKLIEGLKEIKFVVWNRNPITYDDFIGSAKLQLKDVLSTGYEHTSLPLQSKTGRYAGEVKLIMHYNQANKPAPKLESHSSTSSYTYSSCLTTIHHPAPSTYPTLNSAYQAAMPYTTSHTSYLGPAGLYGMYTQPPY